MLLHVNPLNGYNNLFNRNNYNVTCFDRLRTVRPGFDFQQDFTGVEFKPALGTTQPPIQFVPVGLFLRVKAARREANPSTLSSAEVKNSRATCLQGVVLD